MGQSFPSNPLPGYYGGEHDEPDFTHPPGAHPFYVLLHSPSYIAMSAIIFADDLDGVKKILRDAAAFVKRQTELSGASERHPAVIDRDRQRLKKWDIIIEAMDGNGYATRNEKYGDGRRNETYALTIEPFGRTHVLKVAWASNDEI